MASALSGAAEDRVAIGEWRRGVGSRKRERPAAVRSAGRLGLARVRRRREGWRAGREAVRRGDIERVVRAERRHFEVRRWRGRRGRRGLVLLLVLAGRGVCLVRSSGCRHRTYGRRVFELLEVGIRGVRARVLGLGPESPAQGAPPRVILGARWLAVVGRAREERLLVVRERVDLGQVPER